MVKRLASISYWMLDLARAIDRKLAAASIEQAREAVLASERRPQPCPSGFAHRPGELNNGPLYDVKVG